MAKKEEERLTRQDPRGEIKKPSLSYNGDRTRRKEEVKREAYVDTRYQIKVTLFFR